MRDTREGMYAEWEWSPVQECWMYMVPMCIFPTKDGRFTVSAAEVWQDGIYDTFEAAEIGVLDIGGEQAAADKTRLTGPS